VGEPVDQFGRVPIRFYDALRLGEISFRQFGIGSYLACKYWKERGGPLITNVATLKRELNLPVSVDTIRRDLQGLRPAWIDFTVEERQRRPLAIYLTGLVIGHPAAGSEPSLPQTPAGPPQTMPQSQDGATGAPEPDSAALDAGRSGSDRGSSPGDSLFSSSLGETSENTCNREEELQQQELPWDTFRRNHPEIFGDHADDTVAEEEREQRDERDRSEDEGRSE